MSPDRVQTRGNCSGGAVSERFLLVLAGLILAMVALDYSLNDAKTLTYGLRNMADLVEYLAFWR